MTRHTFDLLPTCRPLLPSFDRLRPFLEEIDHNRWYSNFGPLTQRFEGQIALRLNAPSDSIVTVANATAGLTLALREATADGGGLCLMPAWTFAATPISAINAGMTPFFVDVDPQSWQIDPDHVRKLVEDMPGRIKAVVPVAPFGEPVDLAAWAAFQAATGVKVIVDAAAAFDSAGSHQDLVSVVSLHATKVLGVGDGGFIIAGSPDRANRLRRMSNFGFDATRRSVLPGTNAKMSEYSAAVGLAAFSCWSTTRSAFIRRHQTLRDSLSHISGISARPTLGFASATFNIEVHSREADALVSWLRCCGLEARKWWAEGCHRHPAFVGARRTNLPVTDSLAERVVALPFWVDMSDEDIDVIAGSVKRFRADASVGIDFDPFKTTMADVSDRTRSLLDPCVG